MKLGMQVHYITPTTTACFHDDYMFVNLQSSNLLTVTHMEMKLSTHVYHTVSMTTTLFEQQQIDSAYFFTSQIY